jgi:hypothetical protein
LRFRATAISTFASFTEFIVSLFTPPSTSIKTSKLAEKLASRTYINFPEAWIEAAICHYGKELTEAFIVYLSSDDDVAEIIREDLHSSNFGYRENGEPCILDYSGYNC